MRTMLPYWIAIVLVTVPPQAGAEGTVAMTFLVPTTRIQVGDTIADELLIERRLVANAAASRSYVTSRETIVGKIARQALQPGAAIPISAVREPQLFKTGERITLAFRRGSLSIRGAGIALQPGVAGQPVRVRNVDTGTILNGIVGSDGTVEIGGG